MSFDSTAHNSCSSSNSLFGLQHPRLYAKCLNGFLRVVRHAKTHSVHRALGCRSCSEWVCHTFKHVKHRVCLFVWSTGTHDAGCWTSYATSFAQYGHTMNGLSILILERQFCCFAVLLFCVCTTYERRLQPANSLYGAFWQTCAQLLHPSVTTHMLPQQTRQPKNRTTQNRTTQNHTNMLSRLVRLFDMARQASRQLSQAVRPRIIRQTGSTDGAAQPTHGRHSPTTAKHQSQANHRHDA